MRTSVQLILDDLHTPDKRTQLQEVFERRGGKYHGHSDSQDTVLFNVYTNVEFVEITADKRGLSVSMIIDTPPGRARAPDAKRRASFWEGMSGKRLISGGLVALVWQHGSEIDVHLGTISSSVWEHAQSAGVNAERITTRVSFFDSDVQLRILQELRRPANEREGIKLLVEATVMFASVRPFLEALRVEPTKLPFSRYLVLQPPGSLRDINIEPPIYARDPDFTFDLASLLSPGADIGELKLSVTDQDSVENVRTQLRTHSTLDPSQADAIVDSLTREWSLIQGFVSRHTPSLIISNTRITALLVQER